MITVNTLSVRVQEQTLIKAVSCTLLPGRITLFIGKSGAGKTTLLKSLAGLIKPIHGSIIIKGRESTSLSPRQKSQEIGYVSQEFNLFPHLSVLQNCIDPLLVHGMPHDQATTKAINMLQQLDMEKFAHKYPYQLSGGQKQRVAIARALVLNPCILLLDEPTASLDPTNTNLLVTILQQLAKQGLTIALSSQDIHFIHKIADRIYYMHNGEIIEYCENKEAISLCPLITAFIHQL